MFAAFLESMFIICFFLVTTLPALIHRALKKRRLQQMRQSHLRQSQTVDFAFRNGTFE